MSENHSEADSDSGSQIGHGHDATQPNEVTESAASTYLEDASVAVNQMEGDGDAKSMEDDFEDATDELITLDSKQSGGQGGGGGGGAVAGEDEDGEEVDQVVLHQQVHFMGNGVGDGYKAGQEEQLRRSLEMSVSEKESIVQGYQEERETFAQGVFDLHYQLKALSSHQSFPYEVEAGGAEVAGVSLNEMIKECLEFVKTALEERPNTEAAISNLQALLSVKDKEIEDLNGKIAQLMASSDSLQAQLEQDQNIEITVDKTMSSLAAVVNQEQLVDNSIRGKISYIEEGTMLLIEKYNQILSEIYQLEQSFSEVGLDNREQEHGNILVDACGGLLELKRKEAGLIERLAQLEGENRKLIEELDQERGMIGTLNTEIGDIKAALEQEKVKCANTKEKLSMAVTKGKALVQQRDSLKTSLAEKSNELENCLKELQEKSVALEAAELTKEELARSESMVESMKNSLLQNNANFELVEEILSHVETDQPGMSDLPARVRWLVDDRNVLKDSFLELRKLKDVLSLLDLPEHISSSDLESQMNWLKDSFHRARDDTYVLQQEISTIMEASCQSIDHLSISLCLELQEKDYLQSELTDLKFKFEEVVVLNNQFLLQNDHIVKMLVDLSGLDLEGEGIDQSPSSTSMLIDLCFQKLKERNGPFSSSSYVDVELFEKIQSLLYVREQGLMLYEDMLEDEMLVRSDLNKLSNELKVASEEIMALKEERSSLLKDLERSDEKSSMLRDKLSMAVKKGKGLVQDRDNLKALINEKNSEIEQLKLDLQKHKSEISECRDQINILSSDVQSISKLEADLLEMKTERNQFEQFLMESNNMLQRVMECIDGILLPADLSFDEPLEKVKWLAGYFSDCQDAKLHAKKELQIVKEEAIILETKLAEAQEIVKSLEQGLSSQEERMSLLAEEKADLEREKSRAEEELEKIKENFSEVCSDAKSLQIALSQAEKDNSVLSDEKELAQVGRVAAETELERVKDEATQLAVKLAEASRTIKDLEDKLSQNEINVNLLTEKYNADQVVKIDMENEYKKLQEEVMNHAGKLIDSNATIKSLQDALLKAKDELSSLEGANKIAKEEISSLGFKLNSCMEELAGKNGGLENKSIELIGLLNDLHVLMKENTLLSRIKQCFERKCEALNTMDLVLNKIRGHIVAKTAKDSEGHLLMEEDPPARKEFLDSLESFEVELDNGEISGTDIDTIISSFGKIMKRYQLRNKHIADKFDEFSDSIDELIFPLHEKLLETETNMMTIVDHMEIMKEKENTMEKFKEEKENIIATLENDFGVLLSACTDATSELQIEVDRRLEAGEQAEVETGNHEVDEQAEHHMNRKYMEATRKLKSVSRKVQTLIRQFECRNEQLAATIEDLENKLKETKVAFEMAKEESDLNKNKILQLESDIQLLQSASSELKNHFEAHHALEEKLKEKETEQSNLSATIEDLENKLKETMVSFEMVKDERDLNRNKVLQLESEIQLLQSSCSKLKNDLEGRHALEEKLKEKEAEISSVHSTLSATIEDLENKLKETTAYFEIVKDERDSNKNRVLQLESEIQLLQSSCSKLKNNLEGHHAIKEKLKEKEAEISSLHSTLTANIEDLENKLKETTVSLEMVKDERDSNKNRVLQLESDIHLLQSDCSELKNSLEGRHALEEQLKEKEAKISSMHSILLAKEQVAETSPLSASQLRDLFDKVEGIKIPILESEENYMELNTSPSAKLFYIIDSISQLHKQINSLSHYNKELQSTLEMKVLEIKDLKEELKRLNINWEDSEMAKNELSELTFALGKVMDMLGDNDWVLDRKTSSVKELISALEKHIRAILLESEHSESKVKELGIKLVGNQEVIDELSTKVKLLEGSLKDKTSQAGTVQQRSLFEAMSVPSGSEITEVEEVGSLGNNNNNTISPVPSAAHVRNMRKGGSTDHLALDISGESDSLIKSADNDDDKGHVFKSLNTSGLVPKQGKLIADRIDGIWVSGGRILMNRPRARLGIIGYLLILHLWLLGTIL